MPIIIDGFYGVGVPTGSVSYTLDDTINPITVPVGVTNIECALTNNGPYNLYSVIAVTPGKTYSIKPFIVQVQAGIRSTITNPSSNVEWITFPIVSSTVVLTLSWSPDINHETASVSDL
jgi:hypothetical protein